MQHRVDPYEMDRLIANFWQSLSVDFSEVGAEAAASEAEELYRQYNDAMLADLDQSL